VTLDPSDILASLSQPLGVVNARGDVEYANQALRDLLRLSGARSSGPAAPVRVPPGLAARLVKICGRLRSVGLRARFRWTTDDRRAVETFDVHVTHARDNLFVVVFEHISETIEIEEAARRTRSYLDGVLNSLDLGVIGLDDRFNITFVNRDQARLFACTGGEHSLVEVIGAAVASTYPLLTAAQWQDAYERVLVGREVVTHSRVGVPADRAESFYALSVVPLLEGPSRVIGGVVVTEDITRLVRLEDQLRERERLGLVGQIAIALNHEINNPLTAILGVAEMSQQSDTANDAARQAMAKIEKQALRIADVTRRLRKLESIRVVEYFKNGPLMIDLNADGHLIPGED